MYNNAKLNTPVKITEIKEEEEAEHTQTRLKQLERIKSGEEQLETKSASQRNLITPVFDIPTIKSESEMEFVDYDSAPQKAEQQMQDAGHG